MFFGKKNRQKKIIAQIKKKQNIMEKLEEEIEKMGKLALKDGKLQNVDNETNQQAYNSSPQQESYRQQPPVQSQPQQQVPPQHNFFQEFPQQAYQQPQSQPMQQPQMYASRPAPQPQHVRAIIVLSTGEKIEALVEAQSIQAFISDINNAIENETSIQIGPHVVNGRYIVKFHIE